MDKNKVKKIEEIADNVAQEMADFDILDILLDEDNKDPIVLLSEEGNRMTFEQVAVVPYDEKIYAVLKPVDKIENVAEDEAFVFYVDETVSPTVLRVEENESVAVKVFDEYYNLVEEANKANKKKKK